MSAPTRRVRVKVCGVTRPEDAETALDLGAELLGLNFWPGSPRRVDLGAAREIAAAAAGRATRVGVFVNQAAERVDETASQVGLDLVQLHGDEGPDEVARFGVRALKALRIEGDPHPDLLAPYRGVWGFLVEARRAGSYGGSGKSWDYAAVGPLVTSCERPVLIAGGLSPENVGGAIAASRAWGVDVASGVESAPGRKDRSLLERFFAEVRHAER